ncbi:hypothetical protein [Streptosporangium sp. CA-115845]|uniref:hypothetical protein n=1 Tax=Streptosporangium sp. CA-115845 TaxID=3240071 RepID=UPI003D8BBDF4
MHWLKAAELAGDAVRRLGEACRWLPGLAGAACVCVGLALIYRPLGLLAAGAFLLLLDRRS